LLDLSKAISAETEATEFSSAKAQALSKTLDLLEPLKEDDGKQWMQYWTEKQSIDESSLVDGNMARSRINRRLGQGPRTFDQRRAKNTALRAILLVRQ
jgi:hypothetical protein